jgi:hypothetical protein
MKSHKDQLKVSIFTANHKIVGIIHLYENSRLSDILNTENLAKDFIPITDARITDFRTGKTTEVKFISINKNHIEIVIEEA